MKIRKYRIKKDLCAKTDEKNKALKEKFPPTDKRKGSSRSEIVLSQLKQWPCKIKFLSQRAPYLDGADLLIAADCAAYAYGNFHLEFMKGKITLTGCPCLDGAEYSEKLYHIIRENNVKSITVAKMEVSCCKGIDTAVKNAISRAGRAIPLKVVVLTTDGKILA